MCCCIRNGCCCCCAKKKKERKRGHLRRTTTMHDILLSVGFKYAFCRQFIFLTNALLIGCSMALMAAGIQQSSSVVGQWLGSTWYQTVIALGGSVLLTTLLGCTGACYQNRPALILVWSFILPLSHILAHRFIYGKEIMLFHNLRNIAIVYNFIL